MSARVLLSSYNSWRVGGHAQRYYCPDNINNLSNYLSKLPENEPLFWLGLGSNVLIRDGGVPGTTIHTLPKLRAIEIIRQFSRGTRQGWVLRAEAGVTCAKFARFLAKNQLPDGEFFAGIPGTIGGALAMNAGAFGHETWEFVQAVETINRRGKAIIRVPEEFTVGYRTVSSPPQEWFVAGYFCFYHDNSVKGREKIRQLLEVRNKTQPIGTYNCGSVFKNPIGGYAAQLIEASKLKGERVGGAVISDKHANFFLNVGNARSKDLEALITKVQARVLIDHAVYLEPEVRMVGVELND